MTRCPERAEDAVQEAFWRLCRLMREPRNLKVYVFRAVRNAAIDQLKRNPSPNDDGHLVFDPSEGPAEAMAAKEFQRAAARALRELDEQERETIIQRLYADLTFREIAQVRETTIGTVSGWYYRGLRKLRTRLEE